MTRITCLLATAATVFALGCAKKTETETATPAATAEKPAEAPAADAVRVLEISSNDQMKFSVTRLEAKAGETVRLVLTNSGALPKVAMGHNWILLKSGVDVMAYSMAAAAAQKTDYVPPDRSGDVIAYTRLIGPKEKAEVTFVAPTEPGEYVYICSFPGHVAVGMRGVLVVQ